MSDGEEPGVSSERAGGKIAVGCTLAAVALVLAFFVFRVVLSR